MPPDLPIIYRIYNNTFSWDPRKAQSNVEKHGLSFEEAATVFRDSQGLDRDDSRHVAIELRRKRLAKSLLGQVLLVIYTVRRNGDGKETFRIISARYASRKERKAYFGS